MIIFTDIDDMLLPVNPQKLHPTVNVEILKVLNKFLTQNKYKKNNNFFLEFISRTSKRWLIFV